MPRRTPRCELDSTRPWLRLNGSHTRMRRPMDDSLAFCDQSLIDSGKPATHAVVIGVGAYPHLNGGDPAALTDLHGGLGQLSSPPVSARTITDWLLDSFNNPDKPLASVSLLVSEEEGGQVYHHDSLQQPFSAPAVTFGNVKQAVRNWKKRSDVNEENLMLFFFCGHGVARGLDGLTLLLSDYGESEAMPMEGALDFAALHRGMSQCAASSQCYFVDACRAVSDIATRTTATGQTIIQDSIDRPWSSDWKFSIFSGERAYGRKNRPSIYTEELIRGLNGTGSNNRSADGSWWVYTGDLSIALHHGLSRHGKKIKSPMSAQVHFRFHKLKRVFGLVIDFGTSQSPKSTRPLTTYWCPSRPGHQALRNNFASSLLLRTWLPMTGRRVRRPTLFSLWRKARRENS
ncbi:caspase family protein, partial [Thiolapillus sp.]